MLVPSIISSTIDLCKVLCTSMLAKLIKGSCIHKLIYCYAYTIEVGKRKRISVIGLMSLSCVKLARITIEVSLFVY